MLIETWDVQRLSPDQMRITITLRMSPWRDWKLHLTGDPNPPGEELCRQLAREIGRGERIDPEDDDGRG